MLICISSFYYSSASFSKSSSLPFCLFSIFMFLSFKSYCQMCYQIAHCYKPATLSSFLSEKGCWYTPGRDTLFYFPIAGSYNSCRCRLTQGQEHGGTRSKQQYQLCLFTSLQTLGETCGPSVLLSCLGGPLHHVNWSPISFGSRSCWRMDHTFPVNTALLIDNVLMGVFQVKLSTFNA